MRRRERSRRKIRCRQKLSKIEAQIMQISSTLLLRRLCSDEFTNANKRVRNLFTFVLLPQNGSSEGGISLTRRSGGDSETL